MFPAGTIGSFACGIRGHARAHQETLLEVGGIAGGLRTHPGDEQEHGFNESDFREAKWKFEVAYLSRQLADHHWNVSRTAATIGLHRQSLQEKLRELSIRRPGREPREEE